MFTVHVIAYIYIYIYKYLPGFYKMHFEAASDNFLSINSQFLEMVLKVSENIHPFYSNSSQNVDTIN